MWYRLGADLVLLLHLAFVVFVVAGGLLVLKSPRMAWIHLPAATWGAIVEFTGWICPLTPLENTLRNMAGAATYDAGFIEHYVLFLLYPTELTREMQLILGMTVIGINAVAYGWLWRKTLVRGRR